MPIPVLPSRLTSVVIDDYPAGVIQPWVAVQRRHDQVGMSVNCLRENVGHIPDIGWQLRSYQSAYGDAVELSNAQSGVMSKASGSMIFASGFEEYDAFSQSTLTGVTYSGDVQSSGFPVVQKRVTGGGSYADAVLSADQTAFPGAASSEDSVNLDRIAVSQESHEPWDALMFMLTIPNSILGTARFISGFYFNAAAGDDGGETKGTGQYELKFRGDGRAVLFEKLTSGTWKQRFQFNWGIPGVTMSRLVLHVLSDSYQSGDGAWTGSRIKFIAFPSFGDSHNRLMSTVGSVAGRIAESLQGSIPVYNIPRKSAAPMTQTKIRVDLARNVRASLQVAQHVYREEGFLQDDVIVFPAPLMKGNADGGQPLYVYWTGIFPDGTSIAIEEFKVFDISLGELVLTPLTLSPIQNGNCFSQGFEFGNSTVITSAQIKFRFTSNPTRRRTPTLTEYSVYRSPIYQEDSPVTPVELDDREAAPALLKRTVSSVSVRQAEDDATSDSATVVCEDLTGELASLRTGSMRPIRIQTTYDALGSKSTLFQGYVNQATANFRRTNSARAYPSKLWRQFSLECVGEWARLYEAIIPTRYDWSRDPSSGNAWKVTDIIRFLLQTVYPPSMVDVPDVPLLLPPAASPGAYMTDMGARVLDTVRTYAEDYLGAHLTFDPNAGTAGMWRLHLQKVPPYTNLAVFEIDHPGAGKLPHVSTAYGTLSIDGNDVQRTYIRAGTLTSHVEKPEGNIVTCIGAAVGADASNAAGQDGVLLSQFAVKVDSFNFLGLASDDPNYPDGTAPEFMNRMVPILVVDFKLTSQDAVNWKCRRVFDRACWARGFVSFEAPLILVEDPDDALQTAPRPLRYYDPVVIRDYEGNLNQYLILSVTPSYRKDTTQMAQYVAVTSGNINTVATMPMPYGPRTAFSKVNARLNGGSWLTPRQFSNSQQASHLISEIAGFPVPKSRPLQDLDPSSPTFGEFEEMLDYMPLV